MVLRVFVQPGEGKAWIHPKRCEPLAANSTPTYALTTSTALAAAYTAYARHYASSTTTPAHISIPLRESVSSTANIFLRASAKAGIWCALTGAAVNWYYHKAFATPVTNACGVHGLEWKLWERSEGSWTVDDGMLSGAATGCALGLAFSVVLAVRRRRAHIPSLYARPTYAHPSSARPRPLRWHTRTLALTNLGALSGIAIANAYFEYTGERQEALLALANWNKRRALEFHYLFWNKTVLTALSPLAQVYVLVNGIWKARLLPEEVLDDPAKFGYGVMGDVLVQRKTIEKKQEEGKGEVAETEAEGAAEPEPQQQQQMLDYYHNLTDYRADLLAISPPELHASIAAQRNKVNACLGAAEYLARHLSESQYEACHKQFEDDYDRALQMREVQLLRFAYNNLRQKASDETRNIFHAERYLRQRDALVNLPREERKEAWGIEDKRRWMGRVAPELEGLKDEAASGDAKIEELIIHEQATAHALELLNEFRDGFENDMWVFEERVKEGNAVKEVREQAMKDLENSRIFLRVADRLCHRIEVERKTKQSSHAAAKTEARKAGDVKTEDIKADATMQIPGPGASNDADKAPETPEKKVKVLPTDLPTPPLSPTAEREDTVPLPKAKKDDSQAKSKTKAEGKDISKAPTGNLEPGKP